MPIRFKGQTEAEEQPRSGIWTPETGWETKKIVIGKDAVGEIPALQVGAKRILFEEKHDGVYDRIEATYGAFNPDDPDSELERPSNSWEMGYNTIQLAVTNSPEVLAMETEKKGSIGIVTKEVKDYLDQKAKIVDDATFSYDESQAFLSIPSGHIANARILRDQLIIKVKTYRSFAPIVTLNQVTNDFNASTWTLPVGTVGIEPRIFTTTDLFVSMLLDLNVPTPVPFSVTNTLPAGEWLEQPPKIRNVTSEKIQVTVTWEWAREYSTLTYLNRIT